MYACIYWLGSVVNWLFSALKEPETYLSIFAIIIAYKAQLTTKRYASGNMQIAKDALNSVRLNKAIEIINEALGNAPDTQGVPLMSYLNDKEQYATLREVFRDLNHVCEFMEEKAFPPKSLKSLRREVVQFLRVPKVANLVEFYKDSFPALDRLIHQPNRARLWEWICRVISKLKTLTKSNS